MSAGDHAGDGAGALPAVPESWLGRARRWLPEGRALPDELWRGRHRGILILLWLHALAVPVYAAVRGYGVLHGFVEGAVIAVPALIASLRSLSRRPRTLAASFGLMSSSAVLVHLSGGVIETHFHFFVMVVVVSLYQDWAPFLTAIGYVFVHHGVIGFIDPHAVYNHAAAWANPWKWAGIHAFFVSGASGASLVAWRLNEHILEQRRRAEEKLRAETMITATLHTVGKTLAQDLDLQRVVQAVTDAATTAIGAEYGAFFYNVADPTGESYLLYTLSGTPAEAFARFPMPRNTEIFRPTFEGTAVVRLDDVRKDPRYGKNSPHHGPPKGHLNVTSYLAAPVRSRTGQVIGGLFFGHKQRAQFTEIHERIVVGIAAQAAMAMDNARLYESERDARASSDSAMRRLALFAEVSSVLTSSLEGDQIIKGVARLIAPEIGDYCVIDLLDDDGGIRRVAVAGDVSFPFALDLLAMRAPPLGDRDDPIDTAIRTQSFALITDVSHALAESLTGREADTLADDRPTSMISVPLIRRGNVLGVISVGTFAGSGRRLGIEVAGVIEEVARRAAIAVENTRLYARQRSVAETLQHALLPDRLPDVPGVESAARYIAGGPGVGVGGDWYDVIQLPGGAIALAMGDVVGRGEKAASLMGQLRNAVRAFSAERVSPAGLVYRLNRLLLSMGGEAMATMIYAILDPDTGTLRFSNAGHPPPLIVGSNGSASFVEDRGGIPLGALSRSEYHESVASLQPGSTLFLYTDGVVEDRTMTLDEGMRRLLEAASQADGDLDAVCDHVIRRSLAGRTVADDAALLVMRLLPFGDELTLRLPATPSVLAPLRTTLRRWLAGSGASEQAVYEILVAAGEAFANVIQHAHGLTSATFDVTAHRGDELVIRVRDEGRWRPRNKSGGGRGLSIMRAFMDSVEVNTTEAGTEVIMRRKLLLPEIAGSGT